MSLAHVIEREHDQPGTPGAASWRELDFVDDTWCQLAIERSPDGMTYAVIGELMGLSRSRCEQIEKRALRKLRRGLERLMPAGQRAIDIDPDWLAEVFARYDRWRREARENSTSKL